MPGPDVEVIARAPDRTAALGRLEAALERCRIAGVATNMAFLARLCRDPDFAVGDVDTGLIARAGDALLREPPPATEVTALAAIAALGLLDPPAPDDPWTALRGFRLWGGNRQSMMLEHDGQDIDVRISVESDGRYLVEVDDVSLPLNVLGCDGASVRYYAAGRIAGASVIATGDAVSISLGGACHVFAIPETAGHYGVADTGGDMVRAPMPGLVRLVSVEAGQTVAKGQPLVTMEAMKMELVLAAPRDGVVAALSVSVGAQVSEGALMLTLEEETAA